MAMILDQEICCSANKLNENLGELWKYITCNYVICISLCGTTLGKSMNPFVLHPGMGKITGQNGFSCLGKINSLEGLGLGLGFKLAVLHKKTYFVPYTACGRWVG